MKMPMKMNKSDSSNSDKMTDKEFIRMMKEHHEFAIKMSQDYLKEGKNEMIIGIAKKIIADQSKEIDMFVSWLKENK